MRTSDAYPAFGTLRRPAVSPAGRGRRAVARVATAMALGIGVLGVGGPVHAGDKGETRADLDILRQFHSYAPARPLRHKADKQARQAKLLRKARQALRDGHYRRARELFEQAYKAGAAEASWYLGYLHGTGRGGKVDHLRAFEYYQVLARRFDPEEWNVRKLMMSVDALVRVADYYRKGVGKKIPRDLKRAFLLYNMAASYNHAGAFYGMAMVALQSNGRIARKRWVVGWLKRAAMNGHAPAARQLSRLAATGLKGVFKADPVAAEAWRIVTYRLEGPLVRGNAEALRAARRRLRLSDAQRAQAVRLAEQFLAAYLRRRRASSGAILAVRPGVPAVPTASRSGARTRPHSSARE